MAALEGVEPALREGLSGRAVDVMLVCVFLFSRVDGAALRARASTGVDLRVRSSATRCSMSARSASRQRSSAAATSRAACDVFAVHAGTWSVWFATGTPSSSPSSQHLALSQTVRCVRTGSSMSTWSGLAPTQDTGS